MCLVLKIVLPLVSLMQLSGLEGQHPWPQFTPFQDWLPHLQVFSSPWHLSPHLKLSSDPHSSASVIQTRVAQTTRAKQIVKIFMISSAGMNVQNSRFWVLKNNTIDNSLCWTKMIHLWSTKVAWILVFLPNKRNTILQSISTVFFNYFDQNQILQ